MPLLHGWLLHNWPLKLLALALSFLLWTTYRAESYSEVAYQVPIEFRNIPASLEISSDVPAQAHVRVRGRSALLRRLVPADLGLSVDLSRAQAGELLIALTPEQVEAPYGVAVVRITPPQIRVLLSSRRPSL